MDALWVVVNSDLFLDVLGGIAVCLVTLSVWGVVEALLDMRRGR